MPIVYRDCRTPRPTAFRLPPGFPPGHPCQRTEADDGDFVGVWDPMIFQVTNIPKDAVWHDLPDDWKVCQVGELDPRTLLRLDAGRPALLPISDCLGRTWHAPAVLAPNGDCMLSVPLGRNEMGQWARIPSAEQIALINAAAFSRAEIGRMMKGEMPPLAAVADTAAILLASIYLLCPEALARLGLLDEKMAVMAMGSSSGHVSEA